VDATGIQLDYAVLIRQASITHTGVVRVEFLDVHTGDYRVERVSAALDDLYSARAGADAIGAGYDNVLSLA
jgi:hypothetical protein